MEPHELDLLIRELSTRKRLQEALLVFSRSMSARLTLETALESLVLDVTGIFGVRRTSLWMHDREARVLTLGASSDPRELAAAARIPIGDLSAIARGLRVDAPEVAGTGDAQCLVMSLRGWRRGLGTLVIDGEPREVHQALFVELAADFARQLAVALERVLVLDEHLRDAESKAQLRSRLAHTEKMASLGQFVAGIAHEMNNPLQSVLGYLELVTEDLPASAPVQAHLSRICKEAERAATIVHDLLVFTGTQRSTRHPVDIRSLIEHTVELREAAPHRPNVTIRHRHNGDLPCVLGDRARLQRALLNVLINAEQAISASATDGRDGLITVTSGADGGRLVIHIEDNGPGIDPEVLPRIFEPFFSTKEVGQGTGLGLAITYGIVQEHGGAITAATSPGGAAFTIELPVADDKVVATGLPK